MVRKITLLVAAIAVLSISALPPAHAQNTGPLFFGKWTLKLTLNPGPPFPLTYNLTVAASTNPNLPETGGGSSQGALETAPPGTGTDFVQVAGLSWRHLFTGTNRTGVSFEFEAAGGNNPTSLVFRGAFSGADMITGSAITVRDVPDPNNNNNPSIRNPAGTFTLTRVPASADED